MPLTSNEATQAFEFLAETLRAEGYAWVFTQVEEKIALGKLHTRKLRATDYREVSDEWTLMSTPRALTRKAETFTVAEDYDSVERLEILLDAIILGIGSVNQIAEGTFANLRYFELSGPLVFEPEGAVKERFELGEEEVRQRHTSTVRLLELVRELRDENSRANPT